jgi:hypothetical protein
MGATLYLNAVQIIQLVEYSANPFGVEEGGFEVNEEAATNVDQEDTSEEALNF